MQYAMWKRCGKDEKVLIIKEMATDKTIEPK